MRRPDRAAPLDDRVRQLPPARRAAHGPAQRDRRRAGRSPAARRGRPRRPARTPAEMMAQSGQSEGAAPLIARAHHGSVSKEQRAVIEDDLKRGRLPCVVATSSLELGIDMGAVDLVDPDRVAALGRQRAPAGRPRRPPGRRGLARGAVPQAPRRPGPHGGRGRADAQRRHRGAARAGQPARRTRPAGRRRDRDGHLGRRRPVRRRTPEPRRSPPSPAVGVRRDARPALRPLPERRVRRAAPAPRLGPRLRRAHRPTRARSGWR